MRKRIFFLMMILIAAASALHALSLVPSAVPSISGTVFEDSNGNGVQDTTEPPLQNWTITLTPGSGSPASTTTDAAGHYAFSPVVAGGYTISETVKPGWALTFPGGNGTHALVLPSGASAIDVNFGDRSTCTAPPAQMTAWWTFDEAVGPVADDIAGTIDSFGTHIGAPTVIAGQVGNALRFNGTTQYVQVPDGVDVEFGTGDLSIDAWVRTTAIGTRTIADKRVQSAGVFGYAFFIVDGRLGFQLGDRAGSATCSNAAASSCTNFIAPTSAQLVNDGRWHHVAVTVIRGSATGGTLYVDGNVVLSFDPTIRALDIDNSADLTIALHSLTGSASWNGDIDEVEMFSRALSQPEVQAVFNAGAGGKCKGWGANPSLIQSDFGLQGNFEVAVPYPGGGIAHYWRDNDDIAQTWHLSAIFGQSAGIVNAVSLIQSNFGHNFEVIARIGDKLAHFYRDNTNPLQPWYGPYYLASGVAGTPSLIQSDYGAQGNFEVVTPLASGGIQHFWRDNDSSTMPWYAGPVFGTSAGIVDDVSMIQSKPAFGPPGDFDVAARIGNQLAHFQRANPIQVWSGPTYFATGVSGTPSLIQSRFGAAGNFEVAAPLTTGGIRHWFRANDLFGFPWFVGATSFGSGNARGVSLIQSNYADNFEVVAQFGGSLEHFWRDTPFFNWHGPIHVAP